MEGMGESTRESRENSRLFENLLLTSRLLIRKYIFQEIKYSNFLFENFKEIRNKSKEYTRELGDRHTQELEHSVKKRSTFLKLFLLRGWLGFRYHGNHYWFHILSLRINTYFCSKLVTSNF